MSGLEKEKEEEKRRARGGEKEIGVTVENEKRNKRNR
jgi:hypothetical protein